MYNCKSGHTNHENMLTFGDSGEEEFDLEAMRRVQFSDDVSTVEYDVSKSRDNSHKTAKISTKWTDHIERGANETTIQEVDHENLSSTDPDGPTVTHRRRDRRQSFAAQILMAPAKWGQHKDYRQRKMSLHGKPIYYTTPSRRKNKLRQLMILVFNFLERPEAKNWSALYHIATFLLVCTSLVFAVLSTITDYKVTATQVLFILETVLLVVFSIELVARTWSAGCRVRYQGFKGRLRFLRKPFCIVDLIVVFSSFVIMVAKTDQSTFAATAMRGLRFLQILRMVRVDRRGGTWKLLGSVVYAHSKELITAWYIGFLALIFASYLVFQFEKEDNDEEFGTFADALWWGLVTLTTIGYGDKTPQSWAGRITASCFAVLGISFFALPAGILGSGFALKVQEQHRQKHFARRRNPAAILIQSFWRCYAADEDSMSTATWQPFLRGYIAFSSSQGKKTLRERFLSETKFLGSSGNRVRTRVREENENIPNSVESSQKEDFMKSAFVKLQRLGSTAYKPKSIDKKEIPDAELDNSDDDSSTRSNEIITELTETQKSAIRGIRMMKFYVAKRKFKEAFRPYDVKDVIEQYSSGHIDMLARVKNLQSRIDAIIGVKGSAMSPSLEFSRSNSSNRFYRGTSIMNTKSFDKEISMNERLINVETSVAGIERKLDILISSLRKLDRSVKPVSKCAPAEEVESYEGNTCPNNDKPQVSPTLTRAKEKFSAVNLHSPPLRKRTSPLFFYSTETTKGTVLCCNNHTGYKRNSDDIEYGKHNSDEDNAAEMKTALLDACDECSNTTRESPETESFASGGADPIEVTTIPNQNNRIVGAAVS